MRRCVTEYRYGRANCEQPPCGLQRHRCWFAHQCCPSLILQAILEPLLRQPRAAPQEAALARQGYLTNRSLGEAVSVADLPPYGYIILLSRK
jgi:hypothetical protein